MIQMRLFQNPTQNSSITLSFNKGIYNQIWSSQFKDSFQEFMVLQEMKM